MLHLLNNSGVLEKIKSPKGRVAALLGQQKSEAVVIEEMFLATLSRRPTPAEADIALRHVRENADRARGFHDLQFALMNLGEFLLRH
jgi:hypothetical protein